MQYHAIALMESDSGYRHRNIELWLTLVVHVNINTILGLLVVPSSIRVIDAVYDFF